MTLRPATESTKPAPLAATPEPPASEEAPAILVIDDEPSLLRYFEYNIRRLGYRVRTGGSLADLARLLEEDTFGMILLDMMLPEGESLDVLPGLIEKHPATSVAIVTAHGTIPKAVLAIKEGAFNFLQKPVSLEQLERVLRTGIELWRLKNENRQLRRKLDPVIEFEGMIGQSEAMQEVYEKIERVAATSSPVMITGESGTGKELVARSIHNLGSRARRPFIAINCAAIPRDLLESEILGHERGSFTGAHEQRQGCFERADRGTLFLDEMCEMDVGLQAKLLRILQEQAFYRIGGTQLISVNVRIIAATNKDPLRMVEEGRFREDLYYRLNVLPIHLPPLRERREDIGLIATRFLQETARENDKAFRSFDLPALSALEEHPWSGNIREMQNAIEQIVVMHTGERVTLEMVPEAIRLGRARPIQEPDEPRQPAASRPAADLPSEDAASIRPFWQVERDEIQRALDLCRGNVPEVARGLEISAATLYRKIEKYGLTR